MRNNAICASVLFGVALLVFSEGLPNRFGTNPCTLRAELDQPCQLRSSLDAISKSGKDEGFGGLYMLLGETECTVTVQKCRPGTCYSIRDLTAMLPTDIGIVRASSSLFRDIKGGLRFPGYSQERDPALLHTHLCRLLAAAWPIWPAVMQPTYRGHHGGWL
ncbi:predicted protein, partial [Haematococcus lacustris]